MTADVCWSEPLDLMGLRQKLEAKPALFEVIPGNLSLVGIISGYRVIQTDPSFREVHFEVSQGYNDELRLFYIGEFKLISDLESLKRLY